MPTEDPFAPQFKPLHMDNSPLVDIHTHHEAPQGVISIRNIRFGVDTSSLPENASHVGYLTNMQSCPSATSGISTSQPFSIGIHPWDAANDIDWPLFESLAQKASAIGECGIDKACNVPVALQMDAFIRQVDLAIRLHKPLVIHCVKAYGAVSEVYHKYQHDGHETSRAPGLNWLFHGCYASKEWISQMARHGNVYFSVGPAQLPLKRFSEVLNAIPHERLLLETDDSFSAVSCLYQALNADKNRLYNNYLNFFHSQYLGIK